MRMGSFCRDEDDDDDCYDVLACDGWLRLGTIPFGVGPQCWTAWVSHACCSCGSGDRRRRAAETGKRGGERSKRLRIVRTSSLIRHRIQIVLCSSLEHCSLNLPRHEVLSQRFAFPCATPAGTHVRQSSCGWRMLRTGISLADCGFKLVGARTVTSVSVA